jgi:hypothetical protein
MAIVIIIIVVVIIIIIVVVVVVIVAVGRAAIVDEPAFFDLFQILKQRPTARQQPVSAQAGRQADTNGRATRRREGGRLRMMPQRAHDTSSTATRTEKKEGHTQASAHARTQVSKQTSNTTYLYTA